MTTLSKPKPKQTSKSSSSLTHETFKSSLDNKINNRFSHISDSSNQTIFKNMFKNITTNYKDFSPHISGNYYIQMIHGTWVDIIKNTNNNYKLSDNGKKLLSSHGTFDTLVKNISSSFGMYATDIDIPQFNIEYESVSGRNKNLNYASKINYNGDFNINYVEGGETEIISYHENWLKFIELHKKGEVEPIEKTYANKNFDKDYFIDTPYFNATWVAVFKPMTDEISCLIKIMGTSPINLPLKSIIGDRSKSSITTLNINYKSNDMFYLFFNTEAERESSSFYQEFLDDMKKSFNINT